MHRPIGSGHGVWRAASRRRLGVALLLAAVAIGACALCAPAALADGTYVGGPRAGDFPTYVANDHSVYTLRFDATVTDETPSLLPSTQYYVKVRLSPTPDPADSTNRGFTWNPATGVWVQERAAWSEFPVITSSSKGAYSPGDEWFAFKFGDVAETGPYYLLVSLRPVTGETTVDNADPPSVTVIDPAGAILGATPSFWVHNGTDTAQSGAKRVYATPAGGTDVWSLSRTEPNQVDDDGDGVVDDEDWGPVGATGDFSLAVPVGQPFDVHLGSMIWPLGALGFTGMVADVDIAYGALDQTPPSAVAGLSADAGEGTVALAWDAAPAEDGVTEYRVYRWGDPAPIAEDPYSTGATQYTSQPVLVATTTETTYQDDGVVNGEDYHYHVRAVDAATNVGPRSNEVAAAPGFTSVLGLEAAATIVPYKGTTTLTVHLTDSLGAALAGHPADVQKSLDGTTWTTFATVESDGGTAITPALTRAMRFRAVWAGAGEYLPDESPLVLVKPKVFLGAPVVPTLIKKDVGFLVYGSLKPRHQVGWNKAVKLYCWRKNLVTGEWVLKKTAWCKTVEYLTYSRYRVKIALPLRGNWKLRAFAPEDTRHAATWSASTFIRVK